MALGDVNDKAGLVVKIGFFDDQGTPITITTGTWTLVTDDEAATVINSRENVALPTRNADNYYYIGLTGADTAFADGPGRYLIIEAQYHNSLTGTDLDIIDFDTFTITDVRHIT